MTSWLLVLFVLTMPAHAYDDAKQREAESWIQERWKLCSDARLPLELHEAFCKPSRTAGPAASGGRGGRAQ
jgi:hypothetical protein